MRVIFLCREVNRSTGEVAVYQIGNVHGANEECQLLFELDLRQRMNPELQYFIMDSKEYLANKERTESEEHRQKNIKKSACCSCVM